MSELIGQQNLLQQFQQLKDLPALTILLGPKGSGRTFFSEYVTKLRGMTYIKVNNKISDIRQMIEDTRVLSLPTVYYIENADEITIQAANAMLKIAEEPPKNLYIMLGLTSTENILPTIISRGRVFRMDSYSKAELETYFNKLDLAVTDTPRLLNCISNLGELNECLLYDFDEAYNYTELVFNNILEVNTGNSFKISNKIAFKNTDTGIPVNIFFNIMLDILRTHLQDNVQLINKMLKFTLQTRQELNRKGANKKLVFNCWVLNIRTLRS